MIHSPQKLGLISTTLAETTANETPLNMMAAPSKAKTTIISQPPNNKAPISNPETKVPISKNDHFYYNIRTLSVSFSVSRPTH
jgi:hypothetical protein